MKVILLEQVPKIGNKYDVKEVADGFALNFLIPQGKAKFADEKSLSNVSAMKEKADREAAAKSASLGEAVSALDGKTITISKKASDKGHLFAGIHEKGITSAIKKELGIDLPAEAIKLDEAIREAGSHEISASVGDAQAKFTLVIEPSSE